MQKSKFDAILFKTLSKVEATLAHKGAEYADDSDVFRNFVKAARKRGISREQALMGMLMKHIVSVDDMVDKVSPYTEELIEEKIGDVLSYYILLKAMLIENCRKDA